MLEILFKSNSRARILSNLLFSPGKAVHLRELARVVKMSPIHVSRELQKLGQIGLVIRENQPPLTMYRINEKCPIYLDLRKLFLKTEFAGEAIRTELEKKARFAVLFGSFAAGSENAKSDIDLLVVSNESADFVGRCIYRISREVERELNYVLWDEATFDRQCTSQSHLLSDIIQNPIIMLVGDENEFRKSVELGRNFTITRTRSKRASTRQARHRNR